MAKRKKYSEEFTREVVNFIRKPYANVSQIAREFGVPANDLWRWYRRRIASANPSRQRRGPRSRAIDLEA